MDFVGIVRVTAGNQKLLADGSKLKVDSMTVIDLVLALEEATGIAIPDDSLVASNFQTVEDVAALLRRLSE